MKKTIITCIMLLLILLSNAQEKNFIDQNYIEVTGKVEQQIEPNEIYLNIVLNENDFKKGIKIEDKEIAMVSALNDLGVNTKKQLRIQTFNGSFNHFFFKKNNVVKQKSYQLLITSLQILPKIFLTFDNLGISNISIAKIAHSNIEALQLELKVKAIKIAKQKAKKYANAIEQKIGKALYIKENTPSVYKKNQYANNRLQEVVIRGISSSLNKETFSEISIQKITISATVEVKFELQ